MIKIKKIFFLVLFLLISIEKANTEISDSLFMTIGNKPITKSDIVDEIKIILILNNQSYSDEKKQRLQEMAVNSLIKRNVKQIALDKSNYFEFNKSRGVPIPLHASTTIEAFCSCSTPSAS